MSRHNPALDGVRGLAILWVFTFHVANATGIGWVGVDLFFVLSGYLITGILMDGQTYATFYWRRVLRIVPAYVAVLALIAVVLPLTEQWWYWTYLSNVKVARDGWGNWPYLTGHLWSLAVEEQFYLVWPFLVHGKRPRQVALMAAAIIIGAPALRALLWHERWVSTAALYVLMPTRADALAWGALIASAPAVQKAWRLLLCAGSAGIALLWFRLGSFDPHSPSIATAGFSVVAVGMAGLVMYAAQHPSNRLLASRALRVAGKYSYGAYLWHMPVIGGLHALGLTGAPFVGAAVAGTTAATAISWLAIERYALALKQGWPRGTRSPMTTMP